MFSSFDLRAISTIFQISAQSSTQCCPMTLQKSFRCNILVMKCDTFYIMFYGHHQRITLSSIYFVYVCEALLQLEYSMLRTMPHCTLLNCNRITPLYIQYVLLRDSVTLSVNIVFAVSMSVVGFECEQGFFFWNTAFKIIK